jgi:hypothetical protein
MVVQSDTSALKVGLLIVAASWFVFTFTQMLSGIQNVLSFSSLIPWYIVLTERLGFVGLVFRSAAGILAIVAVVAYFFLKKMSSNRALLAVKLVLVLEAMYYFVTFFPSAIWGVGDNPFSTTFGPVWGNLVANFFPCLLESILIPVVLIVLALKLGANKPQAGALKWSLIALTSYALVFWFTNTCNWIYAIAFQKGITYLTSEPLNMLSFIVTTLGLLALTVYIGYIAKTSKANVWQELPFGKVGAVITLLGLYFTGIYLMWILLGSVGGWSAWYAWFLGHNVDLWVMTLPIVGLPLPLYHPSSNSVNTSKT